MQKQLNKPAVAFDKVSDKTKRKTNKQNSYLQDGLHIKGKLKRASLNFFRIFIEHRNKNRQGIMNGR